MPKSLPVRPSLEQLKKQAKELFESFKSGDPVAQQRFAEHHPGGSTTAATPSSGQSFSLADAQCVVAREYGFASWPKLKERVEQLQLETGDALELLKEAFHADNASLLRRLLERYPEMKSRINEPIAPFNAPVITQARSRQMLDVLLDAGADINAKSQWWAGGFGLLHGAPPDLAAYAIERGAQVDIHAAARLGLLDKVRELVANDPALVHALGGDGQTPLHFASSVAIAQLLVEHGAELDARDVDHESTPAQYMVRDRQEIARYLVQCGCWTDVLLAAALGDIDLVRRHLDQDPACVHVRVSEEHFPMISPRSGGTIYQWTLGWHISPHEVAREFGHEAIFRLLMDRSPASVGLLVACWIGDQETVTSVLQQNPGLVSSLSEGERRQVAHAARNNNSAAVRLMLGAGLPVDALGQHRGTPLHWAAFHGNAAMARAILPHHPPLEKKDADFHSTPLGWAIHGSEHGWYCQTGDYPATVRLLIEAGAKLPERIGGTESVRAVLAQASAG